MKEALESIWQTHTKRERRVIAAGVLLAVFALAYAYAWLPVSRERARLVASVSQLRIEAQETERDALELKRVSSFAREVRGDLKATIEQSAAASGIAPALGEVIPQAMRRVRVVIPSVHTAQALAWIAKLQSAHGVRLENVRLTSLGDGERARIEAIFAATR